jgi:PAS domain S-box-containing protein
MTAFDQQTAPVATVPVNAFEETLADSAIPSLVIDGDGIVVVANTAAVDLLGDVAAGTDWTSHLAPRGREHLARLVASAMGGYEASFRAEVELEDRVGERVVGLIYASPLSVIWNGPPLMLLQILDDTARHEAATALRASEQRYRTLFERMPVALYRSRPDGEIIAANQALATLLGYDDPDELIGRDARAFYVTPGERDRAASHLAEVGRSTTEAIRTRTADGRLLWIRDSAHTVGSGADMIFEGSLVDVTTGWDARLETEARARQQASIARLGHFALRRTALESLFDEAVLHVLQVLDVEAAAVFVEERPGVQIAVAMHDTPGSVRIAERLVAGTAESGSVLFDTMEVEGASVRIANLGICASDSLLGTLVVARRGRQDFTTDDDTYLLAVSAVLAAAIERAEAARRLEAMVESKDEFIASVSHEVRTPLTVVAGMAQELAERWESFSNDEVDEFLGLIVEQSRDMRDLIEDLLVAARADLGKIHVQVAPVPLLAEVRAVVSAMTDADRDRIAVGEADAIGMVDPVRFRQIVRNLLTNAIRYGGPHIEVAISCDADEVTVAVGDDGQGVPEDKKELIFEAFEGAHEGVAPGSIGLGLAVSRKLAELMGGRLGYGHDAMTTFSLVVNRAEDA